MDNTSICIIIAVVIIVLTTLIWITGKKKTSSEEDYAVWGGVGYPSINWGWGRPWRRRWWRRRPGLRWCPYRQMWV